MSLQSEHPPLTWDRIEQLAQAGHDDFEAPINNKRARQLVESGRERFAANVEPPDEEEVRLAYGRRYTHLESRLHAANATLERVRAAIKPPNTFMGQPCPGAKVEMVATWVIERALASISVPEMRSFPSGSVSETRSVPSQPEAPKGKGEWFSALKPEAPKGQAGCSPLPAREHARRRGSLDGADAQALEGALSQAERELAAANARIAELESQVRIAVTAYALGDDDQPHPWFPMFEAMSNRLFMTVAYVMTAADESGLEIVPKGSLVAANARADAAERKQVDQLHAAIALKTERDQLAQKLDAAERDAKQWRMDTLAAEALVRSLKAERDQLAARVTELEAQQSVPYTERNRLVAFLARQFPSGLRKTEIEGWDPEWHGCVFIDTPEGQMSWHYHDSDAHLFAGLPPYGKPWDGHTTAEKYTRLMLLGAVEREAKQHLEHVMGGVAVLQSERDQLAARVTHLQDELEQQHTLKPMQLCTPEERKVLEACEAFTDDGLIRYVPSRIREAELANRAAKAKREAT